MTMFARLFRRIFTGPPAPIRPPRQLTRTPWRRIKPFQRPPRLSSNLPHPVDLPWIAPRVEYKSTLVTVQKRLERELNSPESAIWRRVEKVEESEYPESFYTRGGLEVECPQETERVMGWVRKELILKGYRHVKVLKCGDGRYGSFSVTVEKPAMQPS